MDDLQPSVKPPLELEANLKCLQDCATIDKRFRADLKALKKVRADCQRIGEALKNKRADTESACSKPRLRSTFLPIGNSARSRISPKKRFSIDVIRDG